MKLSKDNATTDLFRYKLDLERKVALSVWSAEKEVTVIRWNKFQKPVKTKFQKTFVVAGFDCS